MTNNQTTETPSLTVPSKKNSMEGFHKKVIFFLITSVIFLIPDLLLLRSKAQAKGIELRPWSDGLFVIAASCGFQIFHMLVSKLLMPFVLSSLKTGDAKQVLDPNRLVRQISNFVYYMGIYLFGRWVAVDADYPSCVGGAGTCESLGKYWPRLPLNSMMRIYMITQFAHHTYNTVYHTIAKKELANYYEMITHHVGTMISIFLSYYSNLEDWSFLVLMLHDFSDSFLNLTRITKLGRQYFWKTFVGGFPLNFYWGWDRLFWMGKCYYVTMYNWLSVLESSDAELCSHMRRILAYITFNLAIIFVMNIIWQYEISSITLKSILKGSTKSWEVSREVNNSGNSVGPKPGRYSVEPKEGNNKDK